MRYILRAERNESLAIVASPQPILLQLAGAVRETQYDHFCEPRERGLLLSRSAASANSTFFILWFGNFTMRYRLPEFGLAHFSSVSAALPEMCLSCEK
jgi:hypothetical protein